MGAEIRIARRRPGLGVERRGAGAHRRAEAPAARTGCRRLLEWHRICPRQPESGGQRPVSRRTSSHQFAKGAERKAGESADAVPAQSSSNPGQALPAALRLEFERQFDADFSSVRLHTDAEDGAAALSLGARAYTLGPDVTF